MDFNGISMGLKHGILMGLKHEWLHFLLKCSAMNFWDKDRIQSKRCFGIGTSFHIVVTDDVSLSENRVPKTPVAIHHTCILRQTHVQCSWTGYETNVSSNSATGHVSNSLPLNSQRLYGT